jgi:membrane dipeptidase
MTSDYSPSVAARARANALLDRILLVDGHNDLPIVVRLKAKGDIAAYDLAKPHQETDTDIPRLKAGRLTAQFWAAFVPTRATNPARYALEQIDVARRIAETYPDVFLQATKASDVRRAKAAGKIASFITVESGIGLENSLDPLRIWHAAGVRILTLCHNETLDWIDSATDVPRVPGHLHSFGAAVVRECNRLGIMVDLAHVAPPAMHKVLDATRAPVLWSHSCAYALTNHPRNVPDDVLARVRANGGIVMPTFVPEFISQHSKDYVDEFKEHGKTKAGLDMDQALAAKAKRAGPWPKGTLADWLDHLDYIVAKVGIDHVGIGSDFFGGPAPVGLDDVACFPNLIAGLVDRGYDDRAIEKIAGANLLRVFCKVEATARRLSRQEAPAIGHIEDFRTA